MLCENYLCNERGSSLLTSAELSALELSTCAYNCENTDLNKDGCDDDEDGDLVTLPTGVKVRPGEVCNEICDINRCEDESRCNGYNYGVYCDRNGVFTYMAPGAICDGHTRCSKKEDDNCTVTTTSASCRHFITGEIVPVHSYTRCTQITRSSYNSDINTQIYCKIEDVASYQTNCSDPARVAVTCEINGYQSTISKYLICFDDEITSCDDGIDSNCFKRKTCTIHKHLMCDEKADCSDKADETHQICQSKTIETCKRRVGAQNELPIPISWLRDGIWDCMNGIDEIADWQMCGEGKTSRLKSSIEKKCENVFICRTGAPGYEPLRNLCDGLENCGNENKICSVSSGSNSLLATRVATSDKGLTKKLSFCFKGLHNLESFISQCVNEQFIYPEGDIFGWTRKHRLFFPATNNHVITCMVNNTCTQVALENVNEPPVPLEMSQDTKFVPTKCLKELER